MSRTIVNTAFLLRKMLDDISSVYSTPKPALFLDCDGRRLCRTGPLAILELYLNTPSRSHTYIIHVDVLEDRTFSTLSTNGQYMLRKILEDPALPKIFFDVRMDADALYGQYGIALAGTIDLQLMELSARALRDGRSDGRLHSLARCLDRDSGLDPAEIARLTSARSRGKTLWDPALGGTYDVFETKPLSPAILAYCEANVRVMPRLFEVYNARLGNKVSLAEREDHDACRILKASQDRVAMARGPPREATSKGPWDDWSGGYWTL